MQQWLVAVCAIRFDVEQGQVLEDCYPSDSSLTAEEQSRVAFSAFPDSSSLHNHHISQRIRDSVFFFRFPRSREGTSAKRSHLYGYVFNRERQDERLKRGGEQKSVVVLSELPYWCVFKPLVQIAGPLFFDLGAPALERIATCVSQWPPAKPGCLMELPVPNNVVIRSNLYSLQALPPAELDLQEHDHEQTAFSGTTPSQGIFHDIDLFGLLKGVLMQLWLLWELVLIGQPVLVLGSTPSICSNAVAAIVGLIAPLPCSSDFRPYFTIHDPDLQMLLKTGSSYPSLVLGVTNHFFLKSLPNFPSVLSLVGSPNKQPQFLNLLKNRAKHNAHRQPQQMLWSNHVAVTKPDTAVLNRLVLDAPPSPRSDESVAIVNSDILRRHFLELTTNFLAPLAPYLRPAVPALSLFADPPALPAFEPATFLSSLADRGPGKFLSKRLRSNWMDLYRQFLTGPNFMPWFQSRRAAAYKQQERMWKSARAKADVRSIVGNMSEVELVDTFHAIARHLFSEIQMSSNLAAAPAICNKLRTDMRLVFSLLPKDTQQLLLSNPRHAALLQVQSTSTTKLPGKPSIHLSWSSEPPALTRLDSPFGLSGRLAQELASDPLDLDKV